MKIFFSRPLTAPKEAASPASFQQFCVETELSADFARRFPRWSPEQLARVYFAIRLLFLRHRFDVIVTGRYGELFAVLQQMIPFGKRPHVLLDVEWLRVGAGTIRQRLNRWTHRRMVEGASKIQVFCQAEARSYAQYFGVEESKFIWIPYCADVPSDGSADEATEEFLLASGYPQRDYPTLLAAAAGLPIELRIVAPVDAFAGQRVPPNVKILGRLKAADYWPLLMRCRFVVLSLEPNLLRTPGVITYVTALRAGKCVVVNEPVGASSYIEHGRTGFLVAPADPGALRDQICKLLDDPELIRVTGENARRAAAEKFAAKNYFPAVERAVEEAVSLRRRK